MYIHIMLMSRTVITDIIYTISVRAAILASAILFLCSCATPPKAENEAVPKKPETTIQIASINLTNFNKRIELNNIIDLIKILKNEQVEVLAVQGISRYPNVATRIDFVNELSAKTDWRNVFGETLNISNRQNGNAIFSMYPILSQQNFSWDRVIPTSFEAALQATVDAGVRSLTIVSTNLPPKATVKEQLQCTKLISAMNPDTANQLTIVAGNLSTNESINKTYSFTEVPISESAKSTISRIWYSTDTSLQLLTSRYVETELGTLIIAQFGLSRRQKH